MIRYRAEITTTPPGNPCKYFVQLFDYNKPMVAQFSYAASRRRARKYAKNLLLNVVSNNKPRSDFKEIIYPKDS